MSERAETPLQGFLRNHGENVRLMRISASEAEQEGDLETARAINSIADAWDRIGERAQEEENHE